MEHTPVLLHEAVEVLDPKPGEFFIDGTIGGGGHANAILARIGSAGIFLGIDWDKEMIVRLRSKRNARSSKLLLVHGNYAELPAILTRYSLPKADGLLLDLGFSSRQLEAGRGFSFEAYAADEPLLMTYSAEREPVRQILSGIREQELERIIREFGGERFAGRIARAIIRAKRSHPIRTAGDLANAVRSAVPKQYERGRIDPATRTFQALRIYANEELANLEKLLREVREAVKPGGRIAIISFHSLEDRTVKIAFREFAGKGQAEILTKKPISPPLEARRRNPRSRSAKLRAILLQ